VSLAATVVAPLVLPAASVAVTEYETLTGWPFDPWVAATLIVNPPEPFAEPPAELVPLIEMLAFASAVPVI
jgi:hypothetical protein